MKQRLARVWDASRRSPPAARPCCGLVVSWSLVLESVSDFRSVQLASLAYFGIAAGGLTVLTGLNGQISLGHGALMAVGAYTTALMLQDGEPPMPLLGVLLVSMLVAAGRRRPRRRRRRAAARALPRRRHAGPRRRPARARPALRRDPRRRAGAAGAAARTPVGARRVVLRHRQRPDPQQLRRLPRLAGAARDLPAAGQPLAQPVRPPLAGGARRRGRRRARRHQPRPGPGLGLRGQRRRRRRRRRGDGHRRPARRARAASRSCSA